MADPVALTYLPIVILGATAMALVFVTLLMGKLVRPSNPTPGKLSTYESGEIPKGSGRGPVEIQYYMYILVFLILDIEAVFLLPFAVQFGELGSGAVVKMLIFVGLLLVGWLYALKKGALNWVR